MHSIKKSKFDTIFDVIIYVILGFLTLTYLYVLVFTVSASFSAFIECIDPFYHVFKRICFKEVLCFLNASVKCQLACPLFRSLGQDNHLVKQIGYPVRRMRNHQHDFPLAGNQAQVLHQLPCHNPVQS